MAQGDHWRGKPRSPLSGRKKGVKPKIIQEFEDAKAIMLAMGYNPIEAMVKTALGDVPCGVCFGKGNTVYQPKRKKLQDGTYAGEAFEDAMKGRPRVCQSCCGSGKEKVSPELKGRMHERLAMKTHADLKAFEHTGQFGGPIQIETVHVEFVKPKIEE